MADARLPVHLTLHCSHAPMSHCKLLPREVAIFVISFYQMSWFSMKMMVSSLA